MAGKQAKILTDTAVAAMLRWCDGIVKLAAGWVV